MPASHSAAFVQFNVPTERQPLVELKLVNQQEPPMVDGAWDFAQINRRYARHLEVLGRCPAGELADAGAAKALRRWVAELGQNFLPTLTLNA